MHIIQSPLFDFEAFIREGGQSRLAGVLESLSAEKLIITLEREHWTGRKGYSMRGMLAALIAGIINQCHTTSDVVRLLKKDKGVRLICGFSIDDMPGDDAFGRFLKKLVRHAALFDECIEKLVAKLREDLPGFGANLAVDSTDIQAYSDGHRKLPSDPDARWGAKKKGISRSAEETGKKKEPDIYYWFGYKLHLVIDAIYELPMGFIMTPANESDMTQMQPLLEKIGADQEKTRPEAVIADKGYDSQANNTFVYQSCKAAPIIPIREFKGAQLADICNAKGTHLCS